MHKICLNDQGGNSINVEHELSPTLRAQDHGHQPLVLSAFNVNDSAKSRSIGASEELSPTLKSDHVPAVAFRKTIHPHNKEEGQGYEPAEVNDTLNIYDNGEMRTPTLIVREN